MSSSKGILRFKKKCYTRK